MMEELRFCPSTLKEGFNTYSPEACRRLFGGKQGDTEFALWCVLDRQHRELEIEVNFNIHYIRCFY